MLHCVLKMTQALKSTPEERARFGARCREKVRRVDQSEWDGKQRSFDPVELILDCNRTRMKELMPIKMARMAASPFGFYRGAVPLMVEDLNPIPTTGIHVQICGDAHVRNLGAYAAPDGQLVFDINDFDETTYAPWEWDVKRFAASVILAGRESGNTEKSCKDAVTAFVEAYRKTLQALSKLSIINLFRFQVRHHMNSAPILSILRKAERATPQHNLQKLTQPVKDGWRQFIESKPLLTHVTSATVRHVLGSLRQYRETLSNERLHFFDQYKPHDVCFKVVGTGSVGTRDYVVLFSGNGPQDALFLQIKEEPESAWTRARAHVNAHPHDPSAAIHQGRRVVEGQRRMQAQSDPFLGWTTIDDREYLVRQLSDHKAGIEPGDLKGKELQDYTTVCGEVMAKGHARSGDACVLSGYCGRNDKLDKAIVKFAVAYADQTEQDHEKFLAAVKRGKIKCDFKGAGV